MVSVAVGGALPLEALSPIHALSFTADQLSVPVPVFAICTVCGRSAIDPAIAESRTAVGVTVRIGLVIFTMKSALTPFPKAVHGPKRPVWSATRVCQ